MSYFEKKLLIGFILGLTSYFIFIPAVFAANQNPQPGGNTSNLEIGKDWNTIVPDCVTPEGVATLQCLPAVFKNIVNAALILSGVVAVFLIVLSGIKFITSGGDPKQAEGARNTLTYAIIGLVIVFASFFIINIISAVTGVECIKFFGFSVCS